MTEPGDGAHTGKVLAVVPTIGASASRLSALRDNLALVGARPCFVVNSSSLLERVRHTDLPFVTNEQNAGFGASVRLGAATMPDWEWLMIVNDDIEIQVQQLRGQLKEIIESTVVTKVLAYLDEEPLRPIPTFTGVLESLSLVGAVRQRAGRVSPPPESGYKSFSCVLVSRALWDELHGLDPRLVFTYEDADFGMRSIRAGAKIITHVEPCVTHQGSSSGRRHIASVLPVCVHSAGVYAVKRGVPPLVARVSITAALAVRAVLAPWVDADTTDHVRGIRRSVAAVWGRSVPTLPNFEDL